MRQGLKWAVLSSAFLTVPALAQQPRTESTQAQQPKAESMQAQSGQGGSGSASDIQRDQWLAEMVLVNRWAEGLSNSVEEKAANPQVRQFAKRSVQSHEKLGQRMQQLAQQAGITLSQDTLASTSSKQDFMHLEMLTTQQNIPQLNGANVDRAYLSAMVLSHDLAIDKLSWLGQQVKDPRFSRELQDTLQQLASHRAEAHQLLGKVAASPQRAR
ncbi:DUF4142 domain-containing protein [Corallococcus sp. 4LFB]|uniref:DUF4142 domain-containing protein n=1 Tax=Corallococcus sp. 4LFB TaxID=3383249 RepID=UPI00397679FF